MVCVIALDRAAEEDAAHVRSPLHEVPRSRGAFAEGWSRRQRHRQRECLGGGWCGVSYV